MQGEENLRTIECLMGRLLAESAASKEARDTVELMDTKMKDLEKQLKIETKFRKTAEKKLDLLKNKLLLLNIPLSIVSEESAEQSSFSDRSGESCIYSMASNATFDQQEKRLPKTDICDSSFTPSETYKKINLEINLVIETKDMSNFRHVGVDLSTLEQQPPDSNHDGLRKLASDKNNEDVDQQKVGDIDHLNNSMALVLFDSQVDSKRSSNGVTEISNDAVKEVLNTLKQIKENIQSKLETRHMIKVG